MKLLLFCVLLAVFGNDQIVRGKSCNQGSGPSRASLLANLVRCGGSLVNAEWVLSAGECYHNNIQVRLGEYNLVIDDSAVQTTSSTKVIRHANYDPVTKNNNIMLVKISPPATMTKDVKPIDLASVCPSGGTSCSISGWSTKDKKPMQCLKADIASETACRDANTGMNTDNMICTEAPKGEKNSCQVDPGEPVECDGKLQGIASGKSDCADPNKPAVNICKYSPWIQNTINTN